GLAAQADLSMAWTPLWGDLIEAANAAGQLPAEKLDRYLGQSVIPTLKLRPILRRGIDLPMRIESVNRLAMTSQFQPLFGNGVVLLDGQPARCVSNGGGPLMVGNSRGVRPGSNMISFIGFGGFGGDWGTYGNW